MEIPVPLGNFGEAITGTSAQFFVKGRPVPQGSLKFINGHAIHVRAQDLALWRADIANGARYARVEKITGAVEIHLGFVLAKPKTAKRPEPSTTPDLDKLVRAVFDGLTDVAYEDDKQVTKIVASKQYGETQGVSIFIIDREKLSAQNKIISAELNMDID
jgi:crossover junction endodeoxyribonuclease RusA